MNQQLRPVTYRQQRKLAAYRAQIGLGRIGVVYRLGASRQDDARDVRCKLRYMVVGMDLTVDVVFAHFPRDKLGVLRTEIQNEDTFLHEIFV